MTSEELLKLKLNTAIKVLDGIAMPKQEKHADYSYWLSTSKEDCVRHLTLNIILARAALAELVKD